jgi:hypothetical protein
MFNTTRRRVPRFVSGQQNPSRIYAIALASLVKMLNLWHLCYGCGLDIDGSRSRCPRLEPVDWQEGFKLLGGRVVHELFKHPLKIGERVGLVAADLFDEGVDDRTAPAGVLTANQHPVHVSGKKMCKTNYPKSSKF